MKRENTSYQQQLGALLRKDFEIYVEKYIREDVAIRNIYTELDKSSVAPPERLVRSYINSLFTEGIYGRCGILNEKKERERLTRLAIFGRLVNLSSETRQRLEEEVTKKGAWALEEFRRLFDAD